MEPWVASVVTALIGGMVATVLYAFNAGRRNGANGHAGGELLEHFLDNQERVSASLASLASTQQRMMEQDVKSAELLQRLVDVHNKTEPTIARLERFMEVRAQGS